MARPLRVRWLGRVAYGEALALQEALFTHGSEQHLLLLEHPHVFTHGPRADLATNVLVPEHAYSVQSVFTYAGEYWLILRNPMGRDGGTLETGNRSDGLVYVTWDEFVQSMVYLAVA